MNRSILIVICDFLLVNLLMFSTVDLNKVAEEGSTQSVKVDITAPQTDSRKDLAAVMKLALEDERRVQDRLSGELTQFKDTIGKQQSVLSDRDKQLAERDKLLANRDKLLAERQENLQAKDRQARQLEQERSALAQRLALAQTNLDNLRQQLEVSTADALISKEKVAATEEELRKQQEQAAVLRQQMKQLETSRQAVQAEKQQLATQLQVAESEKRSVTEQLAKTQDEIKIERVEKARLTEHADKLADGVKTLAAKSGELVQEIRENRPLGANTIFSEFVTNRVHARFFARRTGLFGIELNKRKEAETVLVSDGTNCYALCHIEDTALAFGNPAPEWESLTGVLSHNTALIPISSIVFALADPRVVLMPVSAAQVRELGCKVYQMAPDPFKFQEAVLVGTRENYYGECRFQIDLTTPEYLKMDRSVIRGLFGKFNPSHGDLVFNKSGELLGVMANSTYCVMLHSFAPAGTLRFGEDIRAQRPAQMLVQFYSLLSQLPLKLQ